MLFFAQERMNFKTWTNPDGTAGGEVAEGAIVEDGAVIEKYAFIMPGSVISSGQIIKAGCIIDGQNEVRFGSILPR